MHRMHGPRGVWSEDQPSRKADWRPPGPNMSGMNARRRGEHRDSLDRRVESQRNTRLHGRIKSNESQHSRRKIVSDTRQHRPRPRTPVGDAVRRQNVDTISSWMSYSHGTDAHGPVQTLKTQDVSSPRIETTPAARRFVLRDRIKVDLPLVPEIRYIHDDNVKLSRSGGGALLSGESQVLGKQTPQDNLHDTSMESSLLTADASSLTIMDCVEVSAMRDLVRDVRRRLRSVIRRNQEADARARDSEKHIAPTLRILQIETRKLYILLRDTLKEEQSSQFPTQHSPESITGSERNFLDPLSEQNGNVAESGDAALPNSNQSRAGSSRSRDPPVVHSHHHQQQQSQQRNKGNQEKTSVASSSKSSIHETPDGWEICIDEESGFKYYYNRHTEETTWDAPQTVLDYLDQVKRERKRKKESLETTQNNTRAALEAELRQMDVSEANEIQSLREEVQRRRSEAKERQDILKELERRNSVNKEELDTLRNELSSPNEEIEHFPVYKEPGNVYSSLDVPRTKKVEVIPELTSGINGQQLSVDVNNKIKPSNADWPQWSRLWEPEVGAYLYINNHTAKITRKMPKGFVFHDKDGNNSPLLDNVVMLQSMYRAYQARRRVSKLRKEKPVNVRRSSISSSRGAKSTGQNLELANANEPPQLDTAPANSVRKSLKINVESTPAPNTYSAAGNAALAAMTPKTEASFSDMFAGITLGDNDDDYAAMEANFDGDDPFAMLMSDDLVVQSPTEDVMNDLRENGLDGLDWNKSIEMDDTITAVDLPTVDTKVSNIVSTPASLLGRRGSQKALLIETEDNDDSSGRIEEETAEGVPDPDTLLWGALNARATPTGRQVGEWIERVDPKSEEVYYSNVLTGESKWEVPEDFARRTGQIESLASAISWEKLVSPMGRELFWYNWSNGELTCEIPDSMAVFPKESIYVVVLNASDVASSNQIQTEYLWELLRGASSAVMTCDQWVCLEEPNNGDQFYYNRKTGISCWDRPKDWDDTHTTPVEEVPSSEFGPAGADEGAHTMTGPTSSFKAIARAKTLARRLSMKQKNRTWNCVISPHDRCLFEYNWKTCQIRKTLNMNAKQVNVMRRFLLQNTTVVSDEVQLGGPRQLPGGTRHLWLVLKFRAVETGIHAQGWIEYLDELSSELFYGREGDLEWQWERPAALDDAMFESSQNGIMNADSGGVANASTPTSLGSSEWRTVKSLEGGTYWIHRGTGRKTYMNPHGPGSDQAPLRTQPSSSSLSKPSFQLSERAILSPKGKKLFDFED